MILDGMLLFTGTGRGASGGIESTATGDLPTTGTQASSNVIDLGLSGIPTSANGGGARDIGIGDDPSLKLLATVVVAFDACTSCQVLLQGGIDNGSGAVGTLTTMYTGFAVLLANLVIGANLANIDVPLVIPGQGLPRFLKLSFVTAGANNTLGIVVAGVVLDRFDQVGSQSGTLSGYRAGINVAN